MSQKDTEEDKGSGQPENQPQQQEKPQDSENSSTTSRPEGYPPTSIQFNGPDAVQKQKKESSEGDTVDLSETEDRDSQSGDSNSTDGTE